MRKTRDLVLTALFAALVAVGAFLRVPLPAIPFTLQFLFTALAGILLGSRRGAISVACYVIIGLVGFPVFTAGGGPSYIFHPTFGYLPAFIVGAWVIGRIAEQSPAPSVKRLLAASLIGLALVLVIGAVYYWMICTFCWLPLESVPRGLPAQSSSSNSCRQRPAAFLACERFMPLSWPM